MQSINLIKNDATRRMVMAFAHPDDESFGPAGTILHYSHRRQVAVHYICATRGEAGDVEPEQMKGYGSLAQLRTAELMCAAQELKLTGLHFLDYHDSGMPDMPSNQNPACLFQAPLEEVVAKITWLIRRIRPQVVVTHDPHGGYFHPDHIKMHQAATAAFHAAGDVARFPAQLAEGLSAYQPAKLYYTAFPRTIVKAMVRIMPLFGRDPAAFGRNKDIDLRRIAALEQRVTTQIKITAYHRARHRAAACHASQNGGRGGLRGELFDRFMRRWDKYTRVVPIFNQKRVERDLFDGVE